MALSKLAHSSLSALLAAAALAACGPAAGPPLADLLGGDRGAAIARQRRRQQAHRPS